MRICIFIIIGLIFFGCENQEIKYEESNEKKIEEKIESKLNNIIEHFNSYGFKFSVDTLSKGAKKIICYSPRNKEVKDSLFFEYNKTIKAIGIEKDSFLMINENQYFKYNTELIIEEIYLRKGENFLNDFYGYCRLKDSTPEAYLYCLFATERVIYYFQFTSIWGEVFENNHRNEIEKIITSP